MLNTIRAFILLPILAKLHPMNWTPSTQLSCLDDQLAQPHLDDLIKRLSDGGFNSSIDLIRSHREFQDFLRAVISLSPYLRDRMQLNPDILDELLVCGFEKMCGQCLEKTAILGLGETSELDLMGALRKMKCRIAIVCAPAAIPSCGIL